MGRRKYAWAKQLARNQRGFADGAKERWLVGRVWQWRRNGLVEVEVDRGTSQCKFCPVSRMMKPIVADFDEALGQDMLQEAVQEREDR